MQLSVTFQAAEKTIHRLSRWIRFVSQGTLFIMVFFVTAGVIARYIVHKPIKGDLEIQELMMVLIVFLAMPYCQLEKGNVYVELLVDRVKGRSKVILQSFAYLIGFIIIVLIIWQTGLRAIHGLASIHTEVTLSLFIPISPFLMIATIALALMGVEWLIQLIRSFRRMVASNLSITTHVPGQETQGSNSK